MFFRFVAEVNDPDGWIFVYEEPDTRSSPLAEYARLNNGNLVDVIGKTPGKDGCLWYLIVIAGAFAGYVKAKQMRRR